MLPELEYKVGLIARSIPRSFAVVSALVMIVVTISVATVVTAVLTQ